MFFCYKKEDNYLGHVVSEYGVSGDPAKTEKVADWPTLKSVQEVQQFLELAGYLRRFIEHFAAIARPLHRLIEKLTSYVAQRNVRHHLKTFVIY